MIKVIAGAHNQNLETGHQRRSVKSMVAHEDHNKPTRFNNDVAIITLNEPFDFTDPNVQPIEMFNSEDADIVPESICNATGWGLLSGTNIFPPNALQWVQIPIHSDENCKNSEYGEYITDGFVCAGSERHTTCSVSIFFGYYLE